MIYTIDNFPYAEFKKIPILHRRRGNQGKRKLYKYLDVITAFDIETTNDPETEQSFLYIWQFQIGGWTVCGRYWSEFNLFLDRLMSDMADGVYMVVYVHNLSFEFQFLRGIYPFQPDEVFAVLPRKVLKCEMHEHFEFRCSYLQTNMSLDEFTTKMGVEHGKLSGSEFDYSKQRYPWTELTEKELLYCVNDVRGLVEALTIEMESDGDTLYTIPITSTGYVRRDVKKAMRKYNHFDLEEQLPDYEVFKILREAFRGGNTHANRYYSNEIVENVTSFDRVSSYPDVQLNHLFPMSGWIKEDIKKLSLDRVIRIMNKHRRACLMRVAFSGIELGDMLDGCPYIPVSKCRNLRKYENDNGRVLKAEYLEISLTDIDLKIILDQYIFNTCEFIDFYHARYARLPYQLRNCIKKYYNDKTSLKNVAGQELYYMKSKNKLNSIYGMSVQSPVKQSIDFIIAESNFPEFIERQESETELLNKANHKAFQNYAWGVWTTAWARYELQKAVKIVGDDFIYCDTDSVKFIGKHSFDEYNKDQEKISKSNGACATDPAGVEHYLGVYEHDGTYKKFVTMGAKKYVYEYEDGTIGITVAGVAKSKGAKELAKAGGLKMFKEGFTFKEAGGTESIYNDMPFGKYLEIEREGRKIKVTSNCYIADNEYTLGLTPDYMRIISDAKIWRDILNLI